MVVFLFYTVINGIFILMSMYSYCLPNYCTVLLFVSSHVLFVCKCVLYCCYRVATQLQWKKYIKFLILDACHPDAVFKWTRMQGSVVIFRNRKGCVIKIVCETLVETNSDIYQSYWHLYRGADKTLARPGRKQAQKHIRDALDFNHIETRAVIKFLFCKASRRRKFTQFWQKH